MIVRVELTGKLPFLLRMGVTIAAAWIVSSAIDWSHLWHLLVSARAVPLVLAAAVLAIQFAIMVKRWQITIRILGGVPVGSAPLAIGLARSMLIGQPLPSTLGGDLVRAVELSREIGMNLAARSVICDRLVAVAALVVLVVACLPLFAAFIDAGVALVALACVSLGALGAFLLLFFQSETISRLPWMGRHSAMLAADLRHAVQKRPEGLALLHLSFATHLLGVVLIYALASAIGSPISLIQALLIVPPTLLISAVPISLGGWGVREGTLAAAFTLIGLSTEAGVATSLLFGLTGPLIGVVAEFAAPIIRSGRFASRDMK